VSWCEIVVMFGKASGKIMKKNTAKGIDISTATY